MRRGRGNKIYFTRVVDTAQVFLHPAFAHEGLKLLIQEDAFGKRGGWWCNTVRMKDRARERVRGNKLMKSGKHKQRE